MLALAFAAALASAAPPPEVLVRAATSEGGVKVEAEFAAPAGVDVAWEVLSAWEEQPRFVSSLRESRVAARLPRGALVRQAWRLDRLLLRKTVSVTLRVRAEPRRRLEFVDEAGGDARRWAGSWSVSGSREAALVALRLEVEPRAWVPAWWLRLAVAAQAREALEEFRREILRRAVAKREIARRFGRRR